ncbi:uncharacterized protein DS421_5g143650 [Arachis hypogaea]|nr:uncharacterized protein DS421_5g143650 [Arachis hypogaea]
MLGYRDQHLNVGIYFVNKILVSNITLSPIILNHCMFDSAFIEQILGGIILYSVRIYLLRTN